MTGNQPVIFITGNSRSGTTMMMRILNKHSGIHAINEPHFFETHWSPGKGDHLSGKEDGIALLNKLFTVQRDGFFEPVIPGKYDEESLSLLQSMNGEAASRMAVYKQYLRYETRKNGKNIPCEKTPQNVFYLEEILRHFPDVRIINMVRDPRAVMLSQKRKWKRRSLGADFMPKKEALRLRLNYHPITISRLWNAAISAGNGFRIKEGFMQVRFEDLVGEPQEAITRICDFLEVSFEPQMLEVEMAGSSSKADEKGKAGIRSDRVSVWQNELSSTEIYLCQSISGPLMKTLGYEEIDVSPNPLKLIESVGTFPFRIALALLINLNRMRDIIDSIKRRMRA